MEAEILKALHPAFDEVSNGVTLASADVVGRPLIFVNKAFERITGYPPSEALGQNCRFLQGAETNPRAIDEVRDALDEDRPCHVCLRNYRRDGTAFLNELKILPVRSRGEDRVTFFIGIQNDVTATLIARALQERVRSHRLQDPAWTIEHLGYSLSLDPVVPPSWTLGCGLVVADHRGRIRFANRAAGDLFESPPEALRGSTLFDHLDAEWLSRAVRPGASEEVEQQSACLVGPAAEGRRVEVSSYRVSPEAGGAPCFVLVLRESEGAQEA